MTTSKIKYSKTNENKVFFNVCSSGKTFHLIMSVLSKHFLPFHSWDYSDSKGKSLK